ncbi:hypothetical protein WA026_004397 [Henosepilachna vigintioctopunctata]|uniref:Uncharacterized protein n=1 Tax=Henosepilachna vigintioctopunctata TaxID=420089 RepID=A0AAW1V1J7_9CUCU
MVKILFLRVLIMCSFACVAPAPFLEQRDEEVAPLDPLEDPAARSERSTNLSFVAVTARRIQMFIKNRHLQLLPDGTVNGTTDDTSVFTGPEFPVIQSQNISQNFGTAFSEVIPEHTNTNHGNTNLLSKFNLFSCRFCSYFLM